MAAAGLPLLKLGTLFVKTISKPLASRLKIEAQKRPLLGRMCQGVGDGIHYMYSRGNVVASGYKFVGVKPLPVQEAVSDGAGVIAEGLVVGFSVFAVVVESLRSAKSNAQKAEKAAEEKRREAEALEARFLKLEQLVEEARMERRQWFSRQNKRSAGGDGSEDQGSGGGKLGGGWLTGWW